MEKESRSNYNPDMQEEYDFTQGARGKYGQSYAENNNVVALDPDVAEVFPDWASVNRGLRALADIIRQYSNEPSSPQ
jgi:hypothetical protein